MAPKSTLWRLADEKADGQLAQTLADLRDAGRRSWQDVSVDLALRHDLRIIPETLRRWAIQLGIENSDAAA